MRALEWLIALRYLFSRDRRVLVSVNTFISVAGVAVGVAVLIVVMGVMDGATQLLFSRITNLFPHVNIVRIDNAGKIVPADPALAVEFRGDPRVAFSEPMLSRPTLIQPRAGVAAQKEMINLLAPERVGPGTLFEFSDPATAPSDGRLSTGTILLGAPMARQLGVTSGSEVIVIPFNPEAGLNRMKLRPYRLTVLAPFESGYYEFDFNQAFIAPGQFREMFPNTAGGADYIHVRMHDPHEATPFARDIDLPADYMLQTWEQADKQFFEALKIQKYMLVIILMLIVVVAAFNIIGTLVLMVYEKTREIGILKAIGMRPAMIARIFLLDGSLIGFAGTAAGVALGLLFSEGLRLYKFDMPEAVYNFETLPVKNEPMAVLVVVVGSMAICTLASLLPAIRAARLRPVDALRYE